MTTYALNGLGRIGKLALKILLERGAHIAWINDARGDPQMHVHLLEFDTVHGRWNASFSHDAQSVTIDGTPVPFIGTDTIADLPLDGVDVVIDCTGAFKTEAKLAPYFAAGVQKVIVSAPVKDGDTANIVFGINDDIYDAEQHKIVTAASCTTNCLAPVVTVQHHARDDAERGDADQGHDRADADLLGPGQAAAAGGFAPTARRINALLVACLRNRDAHEARRIDEWSVSCS